MNSISNNSELVCRTCLGQHKNLSDIFGLLKNDKLISEILTEFTRIKIENTDKLPKKICSTCLDKLISAYNFKTLIIESDISLHSLYNNIENEHLQPKSSNHDYYLENGLSTNDNLIPLAIKQEDSNKSEIPDMFINGDTNDIERKTEVVDMNSEQSQSIISIDGSQICLFQEGDYPATFDSIGHNLKDIDKEIDMSIMQNDKLINSSQEVTFTKKTEINDVPKTDSRINKLNVSLQNANSLPTCEREASIFLYDDTKKDLILGFIEESDYNYLKTLKIKQRNKFCLRCKVCEKSLTYLYFFLKHLQEHCGYLPLKCDVCGKQFAQMRMLNQHKLVHDKTKRVCHICGEKVKNYSSHISSMHCANRGHHNCTLCDKTFKNKNTLNYHLRRRHIRERPYVCELCGKDFFSQAELKRHSDAHSTECAVSCSMCERNFKTERHLKMHQKSHSALPGEFQCMHCDRRFRYKNSLRNHMLIHTGAKPHECELCGKTFRQQTTMKTHMRTHTGDTPYVCKECPAKYKYSQQLTYHMRKHKK